MKIVIGDICDAVIQQVGNKSRGEGVAFASELSDISVSKEFISNMIEKTFKFHDFKHFDYVESVELNPVYKFVSKIFDDRSVIIKQANNLAHCLYDQSLHPNIKNGEFYVLYLLNCNIDGEFVDALALLKSEVKDTFLTIHNNGKSLDVSPVKGTNPEKLDKGCIIFNIQKENGYIVSTVDNTNGGNDAHYWTEGFLHVTDCQDSYHDTKLVADMCNEYLTKLEDDKTTVGDKALFASKVSNLLLSENNIKLSDLADFLFEDQKDKDKFNDYIYSYEENHAILPKSFVTDSTSIKNKSITRKNIVKLDKSFEIKFLNGSADFERGYNRIKGKKYYTLYFDEEK